jgi:RNA polymerase-binding transcription factor DksA
MEVPMERQLENSIKIELLKRVDGVIRRHFHQSLSEFFNELYLRHLSTNENPTADEMFALLRDHRVLTTMLDPEARELREAVERMGNGTFGLCVDCRGDIGERAMQSNPTRRFCDRCLAEHDQSYSTVLEAMKSVEIFSW